MTQLGIKPITTRSEDRYSTHSDHNWNDGKWGFVQFVNFLTFLTLLLLNTMCPVLANSVDPDQLGSEEANWSGSAPFVIKYMNFYQIQISWVLKKPTDLDLHRLSLNMWISIKIPDQVSDWLEIRRGRDILIYSAWQGLNRRQLLSLPFSTVFNKLC